MSGRPKAPRAVGVTLIQDVTAIARPLTGYLQRHRHRVKTILEDGTRTDTFIVDYVDRREDMRDAVAVVAYSLPRHGPIEETLVLLRRQMRYPVYVVTEHPLFMEVVAGMIEQPESLMQTAARELYEEAGIAVGPDRIRALGPPFFPCGAVLTEQIFPMSVELDRDVLERATRGTPPGDGSPLEEGAELLVLPLGVVLAPIDHPAPHEEGPVITDAKTEILLRRLYWRLEMGEL